MHTMHLLQPKHDTFDSQIDGRTGTSMCTAIHSSELSLFHPVEVTCSAHAKTYSRFVIIACTRIIIHANKEAIGQFPKMWHLALMLQPRGWLMISCSRCRSEAHPLFIAHSSDCWMHVNQAW